MFKKLLLLAALLPSIAFGSSALDFSAVGVGNVSGQATSVDGEITLFSGTTGKSIKRATTTGLLKGTSGVLSAASGGTDYEFPLTFGSGLTRTLNAITCDVASGSVAGCLSSADWTTFNNKVSATRSISTTAPLTGGGDLSANRTFAITQATTSTDGYLSSTDWNTFNNKQPAGNYITSLTGEATASGPGAAAVTLTNSAVIGKVLTGFVSGAGTVSATDSILQAFQKIDGNVSDNTTSIAGKQSGPLTGDVTTPAANNAATTIAANAVTDAKFRQSAGLSVVGRSANTTGNVADITAASDNQVFRRSGTSIGFGSIDLSQSNAVGSSVLDEVNGGTGESTYTDGQILIGNSSNNKLTKSTLTAGSNITITNGNGSITIASTGGGGGSTSDNPYQITNCRIDWSVSSNTLIAAIKDNAGSDPSGGSACKINFRSSTATSSAYVERSVTSAVSVTAPNGATLGHESTLPEHVCAYYLDNSGTVELMLSSNCQLNEGTLQTTTAIDTASDSFTGKYSTAARTSKAIRLAGVIDITQTTAGTWASAPTRSANNTGLGLEDPYTNWHRWLVSVTGCGSVTNDTCYFKRNGPNAIDMVCQFQLGTAAATTLSFTTPKGVPTASFIAADYVCGSENNMNANSYGAATLCASASTVFYSAMIGAAIDSDVRKTCDNWNSNAFNRYQAAGIPMNFQ